MSASAESAPNQVIVALRLGWLIVESYSRLHRLVRTGRRVTDEPRGDDRRFDFSDRSLNAQESLLQAVDHLHWLTSSLELPAPPFPQHEALIDLLNSKPDLTEFQHALNHWSTEVWTTLMTHHEIVSRALTYGGSLADTYWHPSVKLEDLDRMLSARRLDYIAARFHSIAEYLPDYLPDILFYSLQAYQIEPQLKEADTAERRRVLRRLESQAKVWHDLLFGGRTPESYLSKAHFSRLRAMAILGTAVMIGLGATFIWFATFFMYQSGDIAVLNALAGLLGGGELRFDSFQNSALLATISALLVFFGSIFNRLSGWIGWLYTAFYRALVTRALQRATLRPWRLPRSQPQAE